MVLATEQQLKDEIKARGDDDNGFAPLPLSKEAISEERSGFYLPLVNLMVLVGLKGSTKTCNLARFMLMAMGVWKRPVFSDFPMAGDILGVHYESQPFPDDAFVTYCQGIPRNSFIFVDEFQEFFDRQNWVAVESKLGVSVFQQIRKLGLTVVGATQFLHYLNPRINDQMDILIRCKDMRMTPWGINEGLERGKEALLEYYDLCGAITGTSARNPRNPHWVTGDPYYEELVFTKPYWRFFDTTKMTAIEHRFRRYVMNKEKREIPQPNKPDTQTGQSNELRAAILKIMTGLKEAGAEEVKSGDLFKMVNNDGFNTNVRAMGELVRNMGYKVKAHRGTFYYQFDGTEANGE